MEGLINIRLPTEDRQKCCEDKVGRWSTACVELKMLATSDSLVVRTGSVESQGAFEEATTVPHCSTIQIKM